MTLESREISRKRVEVGVEAAVGAAGFPDLVEQGFERLGGLLDRAQDVQALDVPRALPDRVERRLAVEAGQRPLLDVAVPAQALEGLRGVRRGALRHPVFEDPGQQTLERRGTRVAGG